MPCAALLALVLFSLSACDKQVMVLPLPDAGTLRDLSIPPDIPSCPYFHPLDQVYRDYPDEPAEIGQYPTHESWIKTQLPYCPYPRLFAKIGACDGNYYVERDTERYNRLYYYNRDFLRSVLIIDHQMACGAIWYGPQVRCNFIEDAIFLTCQSRG